MAKRYYFYRDESNMRGPFRLTEKHLESMTTSPGVYFLSDKGTKGYLVMYVGRSSSLRSRLKQWVGHYANFFYRTTETENGAFFVECREFHRYGKTTNLDNKIHPAVPAGSSLPPCSEAGCKGKAANKKPV